MMMTRRLADVDHHARGRELTDGASTSPVAQSVYDVRQYSLPCRSYLRQSNTRQSLTTKSVPNMLTLVLIGKPLQRSNTKATQ